MIEDSKLFRGGLGAHQLLACHSGVRTALQVPANVFSRYLDAMTFTVRAMQLQQVLLHDGQNFLSVGWWQQLAGIQKVPDFPKNPRIALGGTPDHEAISPGS